MSYDLTTAKNQGFLYVRAKGARDFESVVAIAREIMQSCRDQGTDKVLVDVRELKGQLSIWDAFRLVTATFSQLRNRRVLRKAAIVDLAENEKRYRFLQTVAVNRGYVFQAFSDVEEARKWLGETQNPKR